MGKAWDSFLEPIDVSYLFHPREVREKLKSSLEFTSKSLNIAETFAGSGTSIDALRRYRGKVDAVVEKLALADTVIKDYASAMKIMKAVSDLKKIGDIRNNQQAAAKAFGKLFSGIGELAHYLPFPINEYIGIFADAEDFFENIRVQRSPEVHFKGDNKAIIDADPVP